MVTIQIDKISYTKTKNLSIKAVSGETYYAKPVSGLDGKAGLTIEAETSDQTFDDGRSLTWINKWKQASVQAPAPQPQQQYSREPVGQAPQGRFAPNGVNMDFMPFVSNAVANAIRAGLCDSPDKLEQWAVAAYKATNALGKVEPF